MNNDNIDSSNVSNLDNNVNQNVVVNNQNVEMNNQNIVSDINTGINNDNLNSTKSKSKVLLFVIIGIVLLALIVVFVVFKPLSKFGISSNGDSKGNNNTNVNIEDSNGTNNYIDTEVDNIENNVSTESDDGILNEEQESNPEVDNNEQQNKPVVNNKPEVDNTEPQNKPNEDNTQNNTNNDNNQNTSQGNNNNNDEDSNAKEDSNDINSSDNSYINMVRRNTFAIEIQKYMDTAKTSFIIEALSKPAQSISFTNLKNVNNGLSQSLLDIDDVKSDYYIEFDRNGNFKRVLMYNSEFCYDSGSVSSFDKKDVKGENVVTGHDNDSYNGCINKTN